MVQFLMQYKVLADFQYGFCERNLPQDALCLLLRKIYCELDKNDTPLCVRLSTVFDSSILLLQ